MGEVRAVSSVEVPKQPATRSDLRDVPVREGSDSVGVKAPNGADRTKYNLYQREYKRKKRAEVAGGVDTGGSAKEV